MNAQNRRGKIHCARRPVTVQEVSVPKVKEGGGIVFGKAQEARRRRNGIIRRSFILYPPATGPSALKSPSFRRSLKSHR